MAVVGGMPILLASTCIMVVSKGAGLYSSLGETSYETTVPSLCSEMTSRMASASSLSQKGLDVWEPLNARMPNLPIISQ